MLLLITCLADHNAILHTPWQLYCRDVCKIMLGSVEHILNQTTEIFVKFRIWSKWCQWDRCQVMACQHFGAKPLTKPVLTFMVN